jgi:hypothetical protein
MENGRQKINKLILLFVALSINNFAYANEIEIDIAPLLNLDDIAPSYDESEEEDEINVPDIIPEIIAEEISDGDMEFVSIGVLNKVTAQVSLVDVSVGSYALSYDLKIFAKACYVSLPEEKRMTAAYLVIDDLNSENDFSGWMIKSLPSVSSMEHSLYVVWLNDCY